LSLVERLLAIDVSALSDADKTLPVLDPGIQAMVPDVRMAGPAHPVRAPADHLPVMSAVADAPPGAVLVIATDGAGVAVLGELFATEAARRGLAGVVIDGLCRDVQGLRRAGLPVFARGSTPKSGTVQARGAAGAVQVGGVTVAPGDVVFADDDGVLVAPAAQIEAALELGEAIARAEKTLLAGMAEGRSLHELTNYAEHVARLDAGEPSRLEFRV
jgi:4-hydroxy-4-methyl-2-oxoglutarate aldolase